MTAPDTKSAASDNSVFQETEDGSYTPAYDRVLVQIIEPECEADDTTTRRNPEIETQWTSAELDHPLDRLEVAGYVELIGEANRQIVVLTSRNKFLARRR